VHRLYLTFDVEDFVNDNSVWILKRILDILKNHDTEGLFFITGHMAEKLQNFPSIIDVLIENQIGYHSSSHSVHPTIFEFTDVEDYRKAYGISLERETAHINPLTGEIEGKGGLLSLKRIFHGKEIKSFRAPGHCWSPPHLEAMRTLGLSFDFSADLGRTPLCFKNVTFYPHPILGQWEGSVLEHRILLLSLMRNEYTVVTIHPSLMVNRHEWDSIFWTSNPKELTSSIPRESTEARQLIRNFELLIRRVRNLEKLGYLHILPRFEAQHKDLESSRVDIKECFSKSMRWAFKQKYTPKFILDHFFRFFRTNTQTPTDWASDLRQDNI